MIQVKAICLTCEGTGKGDPNSNPPSFFCHNCNGLGVIILTADKWDIALENKGDK